MKILIESTDQVTQIDGIPVRHWTGVSENGVACHVFVHRVAVGKQEDCTEFENELKELRQRPRFVDLRHIL
jgi:hypothetical protein